MVDINEPNWYRAYQQENKLMSKDEVPELVKIIIDLMLSHSPAVAMNVLCSVTEHITLVAGADLEHFFEIIRKARNALPTLEERGPLRRKGGVQIGGELIRDKDGEFQLERFNKEKPN